MCFRPATVTLDPNAKNVTPEYRVAACATVDLRENMEEDPLEIITPDNITWEVEKLDDGEYVAKGKLSVPIEMKFDLEPDTGRLVKQKVVIDGIKRYDIREDGIDRVFDPLDTVDVDQARAQAFNRYKNNISE
ncbi:MAG: hypothetical protein ACI36W_07470 [Coriobacteriales bacterium]